MISIPNLIDHLNTYTAITDVVGDRIFFGYPEDEINDIYITLMVIGGSQISEVETRQRVELRITGTTTTPHSQLQDFSKIVLNAIREFDGGYRFYLGNFANGYTEKKRRVFLQDITINNTN